MTTTSSAAAAGQDDRIGDENRKAASSNNHSNTSEITVRDATFGDIEKLTDLYVNLSEASRRFFHPFPFIKYRLRIIFLIMIVSQKSMRFLKNILPNFGFHVLVAYNTSKDQLIGFTYLSIIRKDKGELIANRGIVSLDGERAKGLGTLMDMKLIEIARRTGISRFEVSALKDNSASLALHRRVGYVITGSTNDHWNGETEESFTLALDLEGKKNSK